MLQRVTVWVSFVRWLVDSIPLMISFNFYKLTHLRGSEEWDLIVDSPFLCQLVVNVCC